MRKAICLLLLVVMSGCATLGSVKKTNQLYTGMTVAEVRQTLGQPSQTQFIGNKLIWRYNLHQYWKGFVPYYLVFDKDTQKLDSWYADEEEYYRNQKLWLHAFPPTQKHEVDLEIR